MSNLALKYRPLRFEDLVGQEVPAKLLSTLIKRGQQSRNVILAGSWGSGKSSSARIYGRALNCTSPTESGSPCNDCEQCIAHLEGRHPDYSEYDAASNSKVEQIREFINIAYSPPMLGTKRVLFLDECLPYDTLVHTESGDEKLGRIVGGRTKVRVKTYNFLTNQVEYKKILKFTELPVDYWTEITLSNGSTITASPKHLHYTSKGLIYTAGLVVGDTLPYFDYFHPGAKPEWSFLKIRKIRRNIKPNDEFGSKMFCLTVEDNSNFFVNGGILTHNCHSLSKQSWDSLLKVVEEPPEYLTFIFATTELNKVRPAIVSRCQSLQVHTLDHRTSVKHLERICDLEHIEHEKDALELISFISKGHARDLLSNLEQVTIIADTVDKETVAKAFGLANLTLPVKFFKHLIKGETDQLQTLINDWPLSPQSIYATNLQYLLLVWNRHHKESSITLNPLLETLPHADSSTTHLAIRERATQFQVDTEAAYNELFKEFYKYSPNSIESLTLAAISLSYFITTKGFGLVKSISQAAQTTKSATPQPNIHTRGRRFVDPSGQTLSTQTVQPTPIQGTPQQASVEEISLPSKVYPHTLQGFGFSPIDSAKVKV